MENEKIQIGGLYKLANREVISMQLEGDTVRPSYRREDPPVLVIGNFRQKSDLQRPWRVRVLHGEKIYIFRFSQPGHFLHFFKRVA